jgi:hypothetical protein
LGIPYAYLSNDMVRANYSNSRLALLEFRRRIIRTAASKGLWLRMRASLLRWRRRLVPSSAASRRAGAHHLGQGGVDQRAGLRHEALRIELAVQLRE